MERPQNAVGDDAALLSCIDIDDMKVHLLDGRQRSLTPLTARMLSLLVPRFRQLVPYAAVALAMRPGREPSEMSQATLKAQIRYTQDRLRGTGLEINTTHGQGVRLVPLGAMVRDCNRRARIGQSHQIARGEDPRG